MRTQFAVQETTSYFKNIPSYIHYTYTHHGVRGKLTFSSFPPLFQYILTNALLIGFFSGAGPAVVGVTPFIGMNFALYESLKSFTDHDNIPPPKTKTQHVLRMLKKGILGGIAGGVSKLTLYPLVRLFCYSLVIMLIPLLSLS